MIKNANELQEFINSVRKKAFEDVIALIKSDAVTKDEDGFVIMSERDLVERINKIESAKLKKQKEDMEVESDNLA
jgi:hypothetical protein